MENKFKQCGHPTDVIGVLGGSITLCTNDECTHSKKKWENKKHKITQ